MHKISSYPNGNKTNKWTYEADLEVMEKEKSGPNFTKRSSTNVPIYWILEEFFSDPTIDEVIVERIKANLQSNSLPSHVADKLKRLKPGKSHIGIGVEGNSAK